MRHHKASRTAIEALCRRIVPAAFEEPPAVDLVNAVLQRIETLPVPMQHELRSAIRMFDSPFAGILSGGLPRRFSSLAPVAQDARLLQWQASSLPLKRTIFQALRRIIVSTYYSFPECLPAIGNHGPLRGRAPVVPWEGPIVDPSAPEQFDSVIATVPDFASAAAEAMQRSGARSVRGQANGFSSASRQPADMVHRCEVCVVGSGAGGSVIAARLAEAGLSVVVVEEGSHYTAPDFTDHEGEMTPRLYADAAARATDDASISLLQGRCVGGGSTVNWMLMLRPQPWVMDEWERVHGAELLSRNTLEPALERIELEVQSGFLPDDAHSAGNRIILDGAAALGWSAATARINARGCVRAGTCGLGCSHGAKQSAGVVFLPRACAAGARVISDLRADRIEQRGTLKRVHCTVLDPASGAERGRVLVDADAVVIAAGAVGTPVLLQKSGMGGGGVGRFLRLHPTTAVQGHYDRVMYGAAGVPQSALLTEFMFGVDGYGFWIECPPMLPALASVAVGGFGASHRQIMLDSSRMGALIVLFRDGAKADHSCGSVTVDRAGRARIRYVVHPLDRSRMAHGIAAASKLHFAAGAREVSTVHAPALRLRSAADVERINAASLAPNRIALFSAHVNGTCRMGIDASSSGCTPEGERHGMNGVFVADGSLFPTAPGVNPQAAIMGVASLVADCVIARFH